jgi:hypothetical protein
MTAEAVVIDTDVASRLMRRTLPASVADRLVGRTPAVTFVTVGELLRGAVQARWGARRVTELSRWLDRLVVLPADRTVAHRWGELTGRALRAGRPLPANDAWIAACCLVHDTSLATLNVRHFQGVAGLRLLTPDD